MQLEIDIVEPEPRARTRRARQAGPAIPRREFESHAQAAADHADRVTSQWTESAKLLFVDYGLLVANGQPFLTEKAAAYAHSKGLSAPPDGRAWGAVAVALRRAGRIVSFGYGVAHDGSPKTLWQLKGGAS